MSVLIKDMEMPTTCTMCWLNTFCGVWNTEPVKHKGFNERLENCPLTELIRCKDCRRFVNEDDETWCVLWAGQKTNPDAFCSYAKRKDNEE